jgi:uncharacterized membrane-anchored protein YhcB (DUF1043 family)
MPDGLLTGLAVLILTWAAAGTRWLVKLGSRVAKAEKERAAMKEKLEEIDEAKDDLVEKFDKQMTATQEIGKDVQALMEHFKLKRGLKAAENGKGTD